MKKRDFIQQAAIAFMPQTAWSTDKAIAYAERLWERLSEKGYGEAKPSQPRDIPKAYDKLGPVQKTAFDLFWQAFALKTGSKDRAAMRWLQLGDLPKAEVDAIIAAAKQTAAERRRLPEGAVPKHAEGWLAERRWLNHQPSGAERRLQQEDDQRRRRDELLASLAHAKKMLELGGGDWWAGEAARLEDALREDRAASA